MIRNFLLRSSDIERDSYIWNMAGMLILAFQSVVLLMILTRVMDIRMAGIFTIGNASANLFVTVGKYGMRTFQVSDVRRQYSFKTYLKSRIITTIAMIVAIVIYVIYSSLSNSYDIEKSLIILTLCFWKLPDAFEDVFFGEYQRNGRLDVAGKAMSLRLFATTAFFGAYIILRRDLLKASVAAVVVSVILMVWMLWETREVLEWGRFNASVDIQATDVLSECSDNRHKCKSKTVNDSKLDENDELLYTVGNLLIACFPVFASGFLSYYLGNAPKYAIDATLSDEIQAIYGFLSMPVFVIGLISSFIFNPIIYKVSQLWDSRDIRGFMGNLRRQTLVIAAITLICIGGAWLMGIPVLSFLYHTDLHGCRTDLLLLLVGGGFLALSSLYTMFLTIMRRQRLLMAAYALVALTVFIASNPIVAAFGMRGAVLLYGGAMMLLCGVFEVAIRWSITVSNSL